MSRYNVDDREINFMSNFANEWWQPKGTWKSLHDMNEIRINFVTDCLIDRGIIQSDSSNKPDVFKGLKFLDVGCGGGILTEALGKLQAEVTGLDAAEKLIEVAKEHLEITSAGNNLSVNYVCDTIEDHANKFPNKYDVIVCSEVIEHIEHKESFTKACIKALKPGGSFIITTLNRTLFNWVISKFFGEWILAIVPRGTHNFSWFITPQELSKILEQYKCKTLETRGMRYEFIFNRWTYQYYEGLHYLLHSVKEH